MSRNNGDFGLQDHPYYDEDFQKRMTKGMGIAHETADELGQWGRVDPERARELESSARDSSRFDYSCTKSIALLGDSGQGTLRHH